MTHPSRVRSTNHWISIDDETKIISEWCEIYSEHYGVPYLDYEAMVRMRIGRLPKNATADQIEEAVTKPPRKYRKRPRMDHAHELRREK